MLENVTVFCQSAIKISKKKTIYFDPFNIEEEYHDADIIFVTHDHYDHFDVKSIEKVRNNNTYIVVPASLKDSVDMFDKNHIQIVDPEKAYIVDGISFSTKRAYNVNKKFHPKENNWVGYLVSIDGHSYYAMGDTDDTPEARSVTCDVLFVPIGGIYTMNKEEALNCANTIKPKVCVPIHYGAVVGTERDALYFINNLDKDIEGKTLIDTGEEL
jgi:L-ascorbate metabolism protein UlaG (beta-lactamase superfamily)